jgi:aryl-alcohol dehydrogenase-like predicted oxidoreductase
MAASEGMGLAPWGALGGGAFKTEEQRKNAKEGEKRNMGGTSEAAIKISKVLEKVANKNKVQLTSVALAYVMQKTPYVCPIIGGRNIEHLKGNIQGLSLQLSKEDIEEIEGANSFDVGFPNNFLAGPNGVKNPSDVWLMHMAGHTQHHDWQKPIGAVEK